MLSRSDAWGLEGPEQSHLPIRVLAHLFTPHIYYTCTNCVTWAWSSGERDLGPVDFFFFLRGDEIDALSFSS